MKLENIIFSLIILLFIFTSCSNSNSEKKIFSSIEKIDTMYYHQIDSIVKSKINKTNIILVDDWKIDDFIIHKKDKSWKALRTTIEYYKKDWEGVSNPIIATYKGTSFGDYFHLEFEDTKGKIYDFGFGNNNYGNYKLFNKNDDTDNPKYVGKKFMIYWSWKISSFPCCEGEYETVEAYLPSIIKLELEK